LLTELDDDAADEALFVEGRNGDECVQPTQSWREGQKMRRLG
jgi:hypothetical protein